MTMTHYMELLATNQPWNLIIYMAIPVILAEALVATEFFLVFYRQKAGQCLKQWNKWLGIVLGFYFLAIFLKLIITVVPNIDWRGAVDVIAVWAYLLCVIPLFGIALLEIGVIGRHKTADQRIKCHFIMLIGFLILAHVAMIFGMINPQVFGWQETPVPSMTNMHGGH